MLHEIFQPIKSVEIIVEIIIFFLFLKGITVATLKNILKEMMSLFPDQYFHLGLDEVKTSSLCTTESKDNSLDFRGKNSSLFLFFLPNEQQYKVAPERMNAAANSERANSKPNQGPLERMDKHIGKE